MKGGSIKYTLSSTFLVFVTLISVRIYHDKWPNFKSLPYPDVTFTNKYKVEPYIAVVADLQLMGQQKAEHRMLEYAKSDYWGSDQIYVLCRMLYSKFPGKKFMRPPLGQPSCLGGTSHLDWPLNPIEITDGVPFLIADGYNLYGMPGVPGDYLAYCMTNCDWSTFPYHRKTDGELHSALNKLLNSSKWKQHLSPDEITWLSDQIH
jgi:hypothetical protein